ncbi:HD-GYP domain, c-di-GMP phosphodiesterase class II (or its inactivated variant) [Desulfotomaculum arcticum]|uniref:HD-GYP domain, c-di-GMP phosphodiesterase class II (Or its inactivated variant) n=1 Tax=Desulfotruncus arcticus DSM 17038 TaxID=1121424 RepID=A0A1I2N9J9_9FIRM|nr:HD-GYP domain-containing protein [Desulfotruncus arcticus]SFG00158.1 HD-GYP domain, c-di-GMP phosphodiesterase class II (or its inactivated variant) [Desulfotomaculum arcticum] [Desulfotruncus arcticus DSM 17038]
MRRVPTKMLKPGMRVGRSVINANEHVLLAAGTLLTETFITRLQKLNIPSIYVDDGFLPDMQFEDVISEKVRYKAMQQTKKVFNDFHYTKSLVGLDKIATIVDEIIDELLNSKNIMVNLVDIRSNDEYTFGHCVNTCILSMITAIRLGYSPNRLRLLAIGAILHDLGKTLIPPEVLNKPGKLTAEEYNIVQKHSEYGFELLCQNTQFENASRLVVLHHHERYNGTGYPHGLAGNQIPQNSAIVGLADMYDALTADRVYRNAYLPHEAFEMLAASGDYLFEFDIVKAFLHHVAAYPMGSLVKLNTGEIAVVVENRPGFSLRPKLRILFLANNKPCTSQREIDLAEVNNLTITQVLNDTIELDLLKSKHIKINLV